MLFTGAQQVLCPTGAPCACPTPDAEAVGGAAYGCYNPSQYHCTTDNPKKGLVSGPGSSDAGVCAAGASISVCDMLVVHMSFHNYQYKWE